MTWKGKLGPLLIAEIGGNHEGDFEYAKVLTELACDSGVDAVKFQIYTGDTIVSKVEDPDRNKHFKKFELSKDQYVELANICKRNNVIFTSSVWNEEALNWIDEFIPIYKIGSGDLTAHPLLSKIAKLSKPIIISTGLASFDEVKETIDFLRKENKIYEGSQNLAVLQCTSMYPIEDEDANLEVISLYKDKLDVVVGYSDHTTGKEAVEVAYTLGAEILEMHFTDEREGKVFRDHKVSFTNEEIKQLIFKIKKIQALRGKPEKKPLPIEIENNHLVSFRRAVYPSKDIKKGTVLSKSNLTILRPNKGIDAREFNSLIGKKIKQDVKKGQSLDWDLIT